MEWGFISRRLHASLHQHNPHCAKIIISSFFHKKDFLIISLKSGLEPQWYFNLKMLLALIISHNSKKKKNSFSCYYTSSTDFRLSRKFCTQMSIDWQPAERQLSLRLHREHSGHCGEKINYPCCSLWSCLHCEEARKFQPTDPNQTPLAEDSQIWPNARFVKKKTKKKTPTHTVHHWQ